MFTIRSVLMKTQSHSLPQHLVALKHLGTMTINDRPISSALEQVGKDKQETNKQKNQAPHKKNRQ